MGSQWSEKQAANIDSYGCIVIGSLGGALAWTGDLRYLDRDIATVANNVGADLD